MSATNKPTPNCLHAGCPSCHPTNSVKALKGNLYNFDLWIMKKTPNLLLYFAISSTEFKSTVSTIWHMLSWINLPQIDISIVPLDELKSKREGKVDHAPQENVGGWSSPSPRPWARRWRTTNVCDAWPVRRQTYGYLPSRKASPLIGWYQVILY